ncbi:MAG: aminopeptidase P family protein [Candidatus Levybacteria bacterium]|nr:aminopeptidase P family protein [Candidatus Levybacteria bacterium]
MTKRLSRIQNLLNQQNLDAAIISSAANITYLTGFLGFSKEERDAYLLITKTRAYIFTNALYSEAVYEKVPHFALTEITSSTPFVKSLKKLITKHKIKKLGIEENDMTVSEYNKLSHSLRSLLAKQGETLQNFSLQNLREIKSVHEIQQIKKACEISDKAFTHILKKIKTGVTEQKIAFELEIFMKKNGADISFPPIVAFGSHSSIPHHSANNQQLASRRSGLITNNVILLDFGARFNGYCSDMTRTIFFGKATNEQKKMYKTVLNAQQKAIEFIQKETPSRRSLLEKNEIKASEVDRIARDYIISQGYPTIPHSLGHGIGLQVHEAPSLSQKSKDILAVSASKIYSSSKLENSSNSPNPQKRLSNYRHYSLKNNSMLQ